MLGSLGIALKADIVLSGAMGAMVPVARGDNPHDDRRHRRLLVRFV